MLDRIKMKLCYATISVILSLHAQTICATQTMTVTETETEEVQIKGPYSEIRDPSRITKEMQENFEKAQLEAQKEATEKALRGNLGLCSQISELMGDFSLANKSPEEPVTWKQMLGAVLEIPAHFTATLFYPFITDAPQALEAIKKEGEKIAEQGVVPYALNAGKNVGKAVKDDPLSAIMIPGSILLTNVNLGEVSTAIVYMSVGTASGLKNSSMLLDLAQSIQADRGIGQAVKTGLYVGAFCYALSSIPGAGAALTFGTPLQIYSQTNPVSMGSSGNTACFTISNATSITADFYDASGTTPTLLNHLGAINPTSLPGQVVATTKFLDATHVVSAYQKTGLQIVGRGYTQSAFTTAETILKQGVSGSCSNPSIAPISSNSFFLGYVCNPGAGNYLIQGRYFDNTLTATQPEVTFNTATTNPQGNIYCFAGGGTPPTEVTCLWNEIVTSLVHKVMGRSLSTSNAFTSNVLTISNVAGVDQSYPVGTYLSNGNRMLGYNNGTNFEIATLSSSAVLSNPVQLNTATTVSAVSNALVSLDNSNVVGLYTGNTCGLCNYLVDSVKVSQTGSILQGETNIFPTTPNGIGLSDSVPLPGGRLLAAVGGDTPTQTGLFAIIGTDSSSPTPTPTPTPTSGNPTPTPTPTSGNPTPTPTPTSGNPTPTPTTSGASSLMPSGLIHLPANIIAGMVKGIFNVANYFYR